MAHTKSQKAARGNKDSVSKRLGVKLYGGEKVNVGNIILRQRGMTVSAGEGTRLGRDYTIYAVREGIIKFAKRRGKKSVSVQYNMTHEGARSKAA